MTRPAPSRPGLSAWGDRRRRAIGVLGGSFNPAHEGHRHISRLALAALGLDELWWLVSPQNPLKPVKGMAPLARRLERARQIAADRRIRVTDLERHLNTRYTADTLDALRRRFPRTRFVWIMGADNLRQIHRWERWEDIFRTVPIAVFARPSYCQGALSGLAARRWAFARIDSGRPHRLLTRKAPAWIFLHYRLHPASATRIRAAEAEWTAA